MKDKVLFDKYVDLIRRRAWEYSKKSGVDYEEVEAQGFLIYCECLERFDVTKSGFSTFLYIQLNRLGDFVKTYIRQKGVFLEELDKGDYPVIRKSNCEVVQICKNLDNSFETSTELVSIENRIIQKELLQFAKENLSLDAYSLFCFIIKRTWDNFKVTKPSIKMMCEKLNWERQRVQLAFNECKNFYQNKLIYLN